MGPTATVLHDTHTYSVPPEAIGIAGTLYLYEQRIRLLAGRHEAWHDRLFERGEKSTLPAHRAALVMAVSGKRWILARSEMYRYVKCPRGGRDYVNVHERRDAEIVLAPARRVDR